MYGHLTCRWIDLVTLIVVTTEPSVMNYVCTLYMYVLDYFVYKRGNPRSEFCRVEELELNPPRCSTAGSCARGRGPRSLLRKEISIYFINRNFIPSENWTRNRRCAGADTAHTPLRQSSRCWFLSTTKVLMPF